MPAIDHIAETALLEVSRLQRATLEVPMIAYQVWTNCNGTVLHDTLHDDEWLSIDLDPMDVDAAIEDSGWCGTFGVITGHPIVFQMGGDTELRAEALEFLKQG